MNQLHDESKTLRLTPRFSGVVGERECSSTASAVLNWLSKPLKRFAPATIPWITPLKRGVTENRVRANVQVSPIQRVCAASLLPLSFCGTLLSAAPLDTKKSEVSPPTYHASLAAASEMAANDGALVLVIFEASWCGPCHLLQEKTLADAAFKERGGPLHLVLVDVDKNEKSARTFDVTAIPDLVLITSEGKIVARRKGYVEADEFLKWIAEGRDRASKGLWEGVAPTDKLLLYVKKSKAAPLSVEEIKQLIPMLGQADPAERARVQNLILAQRETAVPLLIESAGDGYLGVRIGASEILRQWAPESPEIDPWLSLSELQPTVAALKKWWSDTGRLPTPSTNAPADAAVELSLKGALSALLSNDAVRRTDAMSRLVGAGAATLPMLREAIRHSERSGEQKSLWLLEDVRWAILIPEALDARANHVRHDLSRGTSLERQAATVRLGRGGKEALPALSELADDSDPLVKECALRSLSNVGGNDVLPAMGALLKSPDNNLRMTAAQALGKTGKAEAAPHLVSVLNDSNEVVVCAAIAALEQVKAKDQGKALIHCLADTRWRVRAAAAEAIGKLNVSEAATEVQKLLDDPDGFVVKNALATLKELGSPPNSAQLRALSKRLPSLKPLVVEFLMATASSATVQAIADLFAESNDEDRLLILKSLTGRTGLGAVITSFGRRSGSAPSSSSNWKPLLTNVVRSTNAAIRLEAARLLYGMPFQLASEVVTPLLSDSDELVRATAAGVVVGIVGYHWGVSAREEGANRGILSESNDRPTTVNVTKSVEPNKTDAAEEEGEETKNTATTRQERARKILARHAEWHSLLDAHGGEKPPLITAIALFVTGDGKAGLSKLEAALEYGAPQLNEEAGIPGYFPPIAVALKRLAWPQASSLVNRIFRQPAIFTRAAPWFHCAAEPVRDHLLEPEAFATALEGAATNDLKFAVPRLMQQPGNCFSLLSDTEANRKILERLTSSVHPMLRAAAICALGRREGPNQVATIEKALHDENPWVRRAALQGVIRTEKQRSALETRLAPFLSDTNPSVEAAAAFGLLEQDVLAAAAKLDDLFCFRFEDIRVSGESLPISQDRPLSVLADKPAFLDQVRQRLDASKKDKDQEVVSAFTLLLAQYGDFSGLDRLLESHPTETENASLSRDILVGINLSKEAKYLPFLRTLVDATKEEWSLREVLKALRGMDGGDARKLRVEVNNRIRKSSEPE